MMQTWHVMITGRVQGVGYRAWTVAMARKLGLSGWVRNRRDGSVEAVFHGTQEATEQMLQACQEGPPAARVVEVLPSVTKEPPGGFLSRETV